MQEYQGSELELFQHAINWKKYYGKAIVPYIKGNVLEVGAGIGETTRYLYSWQSSWLCLEPDPQLAGSIQEKIQKGVLPSSIAVRSGTIKDLHADEKFDTIIYIDVLEHIQYDKEEIERVINHLRTGGHLVILVPAFQYFYNEFDIAIGHHRRYDKKILKLVIPPGLSKIRLKYFDSLGLVASIFNKFILRQPYPALKQVLFWDRVLIPLSKITDFLVFYSFGKSLIGVWRKDKKNSTHMV